MLCAPSGQMTSYDGQVTWVAVLGMTGRYWIDSYQSCFVTSGA